MSTLREAAQQALEALKNNAGEMRVEGAISILETALAQQAEPVEPVAWLAPDGSVRETPAAKSFGEWVWGPDDFRPLYTAPPQHKPLTEEEIDGLVIQHAGYGRDNFYAVVRAAIKAVEGGA